MKTNPKYFGLAAVLAVLLTAAPASTYASNVVVQDAYLNALEQGNYLEEMAEIGDEIENVTSMTNTATSIFNALTDGFSDIFQSTYTITQGLIFGERVKADMRMRGTDYITNTNWRAAQEREQQRFIMEHATAGSGGTCRRLLLHELATTTEGFKEGIITMVLSSMRYMQRGPGESGNTAKFAAQLMDQRCVNRFGSPIDGYPARCVDTQTRIGPFQRTFVDADISPFMLDGAVTLEVPPVETYTDTLANGQHFTYMILRPNDTRPEQKAFVAAFNYCMNLVGPRPTPPWGKDLFTPLGMKDYDIYAQGLAIETGMDHQCAELLAYNTRPNPTMTTIINAQQERCIQAVRAEGVDGYLTAASLQEKFGNCREGLSPYQAELIDKAVCKSVEHYVDLYKSNGLTPDMLTEVLRCNLNWTLWKTNNAARQGSLVDAVKGQAGAKELWAAMSKAQNSAWNTYDTNLYSYVLDEVMNLPESNIKTAKAPGQESKKQKAKQGKTVSADEIEWPEVAAP